MLGPCAQLTLRLRGEDPGTSNRPSASSCGAPSAHTRQETTVTKRAPTKDVVNNAETAEHDSRELDPRDTDHPTGAEQAADNAATESPS